MIQACLLLGLGLLGLGAVVAVVGGRDVLRRQLGVPLPRPGERWCLRQGADAPGHEPPARCTTILTVRHGRVGYRPGDDPHVRMASRSVPAFCQRYHRQAGLPDA